MLVFISLPVALFWAAYRRNSFRIGIAALLVDAIWLILQIQSWWVPYVVGTDKPWQLEYAKGPTTKILPSFGRHVAPDGMHFVISVLLVGALIAGIAGLRQLKLANIGRGSGRTEDANLC